MGERRLDEAEVGGSIPPVPTQKIIKGPFTKIPSIFYNKIGINVTKYLFYLVEVILYDELCNAKSLLDVGTGPGYLPYIINQAFPQIKIVGIDPSDEMIRESERIVGRNPNIKILKASAMQIPYENESFDLIISTFSIKHWEDVGKGLSEVYRVLKNNGKFWCVDLDKNADSSKLDRMFQITSPVYKFFAKYIIKSTIRSVGVSSDELNSLLQKIPFHGKFVSAKFLPIIYAKLSK